MLQVGHSAGTQIRDVPLLGLDLAENPVDGETHENLTSSISLLSMGQGNVLGYAPSGLEREVFNLVNQERARGFRCPDGTYFYANNRPLQWDCRLFRAARKWSMRMANENFIAHRKDGSNSCVRTEAEGYPHKRGCGENIAGGSQTAQGILQSWKESKEHCKNMFEPKYTKSGVGIASNPNSQFRVYSTNAFGDDVCSPDESCQGGYPAPTPAPGCGDKDVNCQTYKEQGYCDYSPNVQSLCKDTCSIGNCRLCGGSPAPAPAPAPNPPAGPAPGGSGGDGDPNCGLYASKGYCSSDRIKRLCAQSCGCSDGDPNCQLYASKGYCGDNRINQLCCSACR